MENYRQTEQGASLLEESRKHVGQEQRCLLGHHVFELGSALQPDGGVGVALIDRRELCITASLRAIDHCEHEIMQILEDLTVCDDDYKANNLAKKRKELAERLAMSYLTYGKELESEKNYEGAVDVYSKAVKALENIPDADQRLVDKIGKIRGVALSKKIESINSVQNRQSNLNVSELSYFASIGETKYFGSQVNLSKNIRIGRNMNTAYTSKLLSSKLVQKILGTYDLRRDRRLMEQESTS